MNLTVYQDILTNEIDLIGKCLVFPQRSFTFQHDNAPCHQSASAVSFLENNNICLLDWPVNSPDREFMAYNQKQNEYLGPLNAEEM